MPVRVSGRAATPHFSRRLSVSGLRSEHWDRDYLLGAQVFPNQAAGTPRRWAHNHLIRRDDVVHAEVVLGLGNVVLDYLEPMNWRNDHCLVGYQARFDQEGDFKIGVSGTLADTGTRAIDRDAATHHHVDDKWGQIC